MGAKDYYQILGVNEGASQNEIKSTYRRLAKQYHPDTNPGNKQAEERFKEVSEAYEVLGDNQKRQKYDQMRKFGFREQSRGFDFGDFDFDIFRQGEKTKGPDGFTFSFKGFDRFVGLGDLFSQFFDLGERTRQERYGPRKGDNLFVEISIPFDLAITGGSTNFSVDKDKICPSCQGGGAKPGSKVQICKECKGIGTITFGQGGFGVSRPCPRCYGRGKIITNPCDSCQGKGQIRAKRKYSVKIPPCIDHGEQIRLKNQGQPGFAGGPTGDMIVTVRILPHRFFKREGNNINCEVLLRLSQAVLGTTLRVKTVTGKKVHVKIPPGTQNETTFRLAGMGIVKNGKKGDQYITIHVEIPKNLSDEERELIKKFTEKHKQTSKN
jgi:molecular chaperone DnaJ